MVRAHAVLWKLKQKRLWRRRSWLHVMSFCALIIILFFSFFNLDSVLFNWNLFPCFWLRHINVWWSLIVAFLTCIRYILLTFQHYISYSNKLNCSRLWDSRGESVKRKRVWKTRGGFSITRFLFSRCLSIIFVLSLLSESLEQASNRWEILID